MLEVLHHSRERGSMGVMKWCSYSVGGRCSSCSGLIEECVCRISKWEVKISLYSNSVKRVKKSPLWTKWERRCNYYLPSDFLQLIWIFPWYKKHMGSDPFHVSKFIPDHRKKALSRILGKNSSSYKYALERIKQYTISKLYHLSILYLSQSELRTFLFFLNQGSVGKCLWLLLNFPLKENFSLFGQFQVTADCSYFPQVVIFVIITIRFYLFFSIFIYVCLCACMDMHHTCVSAHRCQKRESDPVELHLEIVLSHRLRALETGLESSGLAKGALNLQITSSFPNNYILKYCH